MLLNAGISEQEVLRLACDAAGCEPADFKRLSPALGGLLPHNIAMKHRVVPLGVHDGALSVATSNPRSPALERELAFASKQRVRLHAASPSDILGAQAVIYGAAYGTAPDFNAFRTQAPVAPPRPAPVARLSLAMPAETRATESSAPPSAAVPAEPSAAADVSDRLFAAASAEHASAVMLEPASENGLLVRLRIDGTLNDRFRIAAEPAVRLMQSLEMRANLGPRTVGQPRQGRTTFQSAGGLVAVRVSTAPLRDGRERTVIRLFAAASLLNVSELGYSSSEQHRLRQLLGLPAGLLVVAGPAGSGTTTTLYAVARELRTAGRTVSTVEEPIDYPLDQLAQVQLSESPHATVAAAARAALVVQGTALIIGAPLDAPTMEHLGTPGGRAHLVIASLGTSDMPSTLSRLSELHEDRARLAEMLVGVVAQRLLRRLCTACAAPQLVSELPEQQQQLLFGLPMAKLHRPVGCATCRNTGYNGRMAIAEVVPMIPPVRAALAGGATQAELAHAARENGMTTLWDSGMSRVLDGLTSLSELLDTVAPPVEDGGAAPQEDIDALLAQLLGSPHMQPGAASQATSPAATPVAPATAPEAVPGGPLRVLLVDDDAAARRALAHDLAEAGFRVLQVADGTAAVSFAKRLRPDIVLTEVAIPRLDVIAMLGALASGDAPLTVVVHTAQDDEALRSWLREAGARDVLQRDMPTVALAERLREIARAALT